MRGLVKSAGLTFFAAASLAGQAASATETTTYTYDALGRISVVKHSGQVNNGLQATYQHDNGDNRQNMTVTGSPFNSSVRIVVVPLGGMTVIPIGKASN